jgi:signal transduction histidine kinase
VPLSHVVQASEKAAHLTQQMLAYAGKGRFVTEKLDLSTLVEEISSLIQTSIPKNVQLRLELSKGLPAINADPGQIQQLIMNLVINGAEAIGETHNGTVFVTTDIQEIDDAYIRQNFAGDPMRLGRYVSLEVQDTGCGMTRKQRREFSIRFRQNLRPETSAWQPRSIVRGIGDHPNLQCSGKN